MATLILVAHFSPRGLDGGWLSPNAFQRSVGSGDYNHYAMTGSRSGLGGGPFGGPGIQSTKPRSDAAGVAWHLSSGLCLHLIQPKSDFFYSDPDSIHLLALCAIDQDM